MRSKQGWILTLMKYNDRKIVFLDTIWSKMVDF